MQKNYTNPNALKRRCESNKTCDRDLNTTTRSTQTQMWPSYNAPTENVAQIPWEPKGNVLKMRILGAYASDPKMKMHILWCICAIKLPCMFVTITTNVLIYYDKIVGSFKRRILYVKRRVQMKEDGWPWPWVWGMKVNKKWQPILTRKSSLRKVKSISRHLEIPVF